MTWAHTPFHSPHTLVLWLNRAHCPLQYLSQSSPKLIHRRRDKAPAGALKRSHRFNFQAAGTALGTQSAYKRAIDRTQGRESLWPGSWALADLIPNQDTQTSLLGVVLLWAVFGRQVTTAFGRKSALQMSLQKPFARCSATSRSALLRSLAARPLSFLGPESDFTSGLSPKAFSSRTLEPDEGFPLAHCRVLHASKIQVTTYWSYVCKRDRE